MELSWECRMCLGSSSWWDLSDMDPLGSPAWSPAQEGLVLAHCCKWNPWQGISPRFLCQAKAVSQLQRSTQMSLD